MNCETFESRSQQLLDRREDLTADEELAAHASSCDHCWSVWRTYQAIYQSYPTAPMGLRGDSSFASRVLDEVLSSSARTPETLHDEATSSSVEVAASASDKSVTDKAWSSAVRIRNQRVPHWLGVAVACLAIAVVTIAIWPGLRSGTSDGIATNLPSTIDPWASSPSMAGVADVDPLTGVAWESINEVAWSKLGDGSMAVVRPITRPLHVAYDLLLQNLRIARDAGVGIRDDERWRMILDNVA